MALSGLPAGADADALPASALERLVLTSPPPMDPVWVQYETEQNMPCPPQRSEPPLERQPRYAVECRELSERMRAPGARDAHLSEGIATRAFVVPSTQDDYAIPVLAYEREGNVGPETGPETGPEEVDPPTIVLYIHGGGLHVGEADSEDLSCRRIVKEAAAVTVLYSVGYRLMPRYPAATCVADCLDVFRHVRQRLHPGGDGGGGGGARLLLVGSSSGGELAALVAQTAAETGEPGPQGVLLRCPVTSDAFQPDVAAYVPARLRPLHTTAANRAFMTSLLGPMRRARPRDGLARMPLEADPDTVLRRQAPHWIQVCTNDMLYADGVCYAKALADEGVPVRVDVVRGWPHTFWLPAPWMDRALEAERAMVDGLAWLVQVGRCA